MYSILEFLGLAYIDQDKINPQASYLGDKNEEFN
jgi:hypothetical protein